MERIRETLHAFRVEFDTFFLEGSLHEGDPSPVDIAFGRLRDQGHLYESEGALWLRTTEFGDDKDRVLRRSDRRADVLRRRRRLPGGQVPAAGSTRRSTSWAPTTTGTWRG